MKKLFLIASLFLLINSNSFLLLSQKPIASLPFELVGDYIIVKASINNNPPLSFILDTGVRRTIITELSENDSISFEYVERREMLGLGYGKSLFAFVSNNNQIQVGRLKMPSRTVYVLESDVLNLSRQTGTKVNGLLGFDFFENHVVQIDYTTRRIRFYESDMFVAPKKYTPVPLDIINQKIFVDLLISDANNYCRKSKVLIDTGARLNAWFQTFTEDALSVPDKNIYGRLGEGFSGEISGKLSRFPKLCLGNFCFKNTTIAFPDSIAISGILLDGDRDGTVGSSLLRRFNLYFDVKRSILYLKPNSYFSKSFTYNVAGMEIVQIIQNLPHYRVVSVWEGSPAEEAGIRVGDSIIEINREKVFSLTLSQVRGILERPSSRPLKIVLLRNDGERIEVNLNMKARI